MILTAHHRAASVYPVEVSGWDCTEAFFVEKADLEWDEDSGKYVVLNHKLREGAHVFVRLIQAGLSGRTYPVPYAARFARTTEEGRFQFQLIPAHPRVEWTG